MSEDKVVIEPGGPMTPEALREVAYWLDTLDEIAALYFRLLVEVGKKTEEDVAGALNTVQGKEVQDDLKRWADEIEQHA